MWDATLLNRIRDRKLNEIIKYALSARLNPGAPSDNIVLIGSLCDDVQACDSLIRDREAKVVANSIDMPAYLDSLSESDRSDEEEFSKMKIPSKEDVPDVDAIVDMINRTIDECRVDDSSSKEAIESLKSELKVCRERIEQLSEELDFARGEIQVMEEMKAQPVKVDLSWVEAELTPILVKMDQLADSQSDDEGYYMETMSSVKSIVDDIVSRAEEASNAVVDTEIIKKLYSVQTSIDISIQLFEREDVYSEAMVPEEEVSDSVPDTSKPDVTCDDAVVESETVEEEAPVEVEPVSDFRDELLTVDEISILSQVQDMKSSKIDYFIDMSLSGRFNEDACEDVIDFLKVDVDICKVILSMDYSDKASIENGFIGLLSILEVAEEPKHQNMYVNSLNPDERILEEGYNNIVAKIQDAFIEKYAYLTEE